MGRCQWLLQQGLRSESIQLAESEPKLLEAVAALDFPERVEWDDLVQMHELTSAPRLPIEPARLLNEAYAEQDPAKPPVIFVVPYLKVHGNWAWIRVEPQTKDGKQRYEPHLQA